MREVNDPLFVIVDPDGEAPSEVCAGPVEGGRCPVADEGARLPCAGRKLVLIRSDFSPRWWRSVAPDETECPLPILVAGGG